MFVPLKLVYFIVEPLHTVGLALIGGALAARLGLRRLGRGLTLVGALYAALIVLTPTPEALVGWLERRAAPSALGLDAVAGAIVLGGSTDDGRVAAEHETYALNEAAERLTEAAALRERRPDLPILFSGGSGRLDDPGLLEGEITRRLMAALGVAPEGLMFEERSRTTAENARYSAELIAERRAAGALADADGRPWLLVTSAWHMPRALASFRAVGLEVEARPTDFRAPAPSWSPLRWNAERRFRLMRVAMTELVGLVGYRLLGRTDTLAPTR